MYADALEPFKQITSEAATPNAYSVLQDLDQEKTCHIAEAADLGLMLGGGLLKTEGVFGVNNGTVERASWSDAKGWNVKFSSSGGKTRSVSSDLLFFVYWFSPHAILVLRNLYNLATSPDQEFQNLRIKWFTRHELRYAEERDGWIKRDNTGLKGEVATWAKQNLEADTLPTSDVSKYLEKVKTSAEMEKEDYEKHLPGCNGVVQAIGFTKNKLPTIERDATPLEITYNHETSEFVDSEGKTIRGLYGAGIAFPEKVVDPEGTTEYAVGLWKFMKYLKRVAPTWTA
ncbi:hypothetical protein H4I96_08136 [Botrytis cinerea]